jgi:hypothetical protein
MPGRRNSIPFEREALFILLTIWFGSYGKYFRKNKRAEEKTWGKKGGDEARLKRGESFFELPTVVAA